VGAGVDAGGTAANPTIVNNVETLATVPHILTNGPEWYRALGTWDSPGTMVFTVVGDVVRPGYAELELGTTIRDVIEQVGGGPRPGHQIRAVVSGVANGVITADNLDVPATYEHLAAIGSGLGSAGLIVYDDTADMVAVTRMFARFLHVESCGQCGACKLHSGTISDTLEQLELGAADDRDVEEIGAALRMVTDQNGCYLPVVLQTVVASIMRAFPADFVTHLEGTPTPSRPYRLPKIVDMAYGTVTYDAGTALEQLDRTYVDVRRAG
jgi:NADH-quinone oxidoreductase subunit F